MKPTPLSPSGIYLGEERNQNMHEVSGIDRRIHVVRSKIGDAFGKTKTLKNYDS